MDGETPTFGLDGAVFDREAYGRFKLPRLLAASIAGYDDPAMVPAVSAGHLRADDYVLGLVHRGEARVYPLWVIDNYHVVNDRFGTERVVVTSCERCQSGAAFVADPPGDSDRDPLFRATGVMNAVLTMTDLRSGSLWNHYDGVALRGPAAGTALPWIPTFHMEWADWLALHPETLVMEPPGDPQHPDARHGHGREEWFARPGMDPLFVETISGPLDARYPEHEPVLGIDEGGERRAYPLREVQRDGGVVQEDVGGRSLVVLAGPRDDGFTMAAFRPVTGGAELRFHRRDGAFVDEGTGSRWTIEGVAVEGPLAGARVEPVRWFAVRWHAWAYARRDTTLHLGRVRLPIQRSTGGRGDRSGTLAALVGALVGERHEVRVVGPVVSQLRPRRSLESLSLEVDGDPVVLHRFGSRAAARDHEALKGARSAIPLRTRWGDGRVQRVGPVVVQADPEAMFADPANIVPLPWSEVRWSPLVGSDTFARAAAAAGFGDDADGLDDGWGFVDVMRSLRAARFEVLDAGFLPPHQLRVGCEDGIALTVDADRFLLYRFERDADAATFATAIGHALAVGPLVARSTPDTMYRHQGYEILYAGDARIRWSPLVEDERLRRTLSAAVGHRRKGDERRRGGGDPDLHP